MKKKEAKIQVLKGLIDFMRNKAVEDWKKECEDEDKGECDPEESDSEDMSEDSDEMSEKTIIVAVPKKKK
jgi:hypothetical protein